MTDWTPGDETGIKTIEVSSLNELIKLARDLAKKNSWDCEDEKWGSPPFFANGIWYRGQRMIVEPQPSISHYRPPGSKKDDRYDEVTLFTDFRASLGYRAGMPTEAEALPWMAVMRHYDLPNRVLDWSKSMLAALLFALCENSALDQPSAALEPHLWVLNARALNEVTHCSSYLTNRLGPNSQPGRPYIWCPDSFPAVLRAEQVRGRRPGQWIKVLKHIHPASRGYPSDAFLDQLEAELRTWGSGSRDWVSYHARIQSYIQQQSSLGMEMSNRLWQLVTPGAVQPPWNNPRILAQKGMLTVHGGALNNSSDPNDVRPPAKDLAFVVKNCAAPGMILRRIDIDIDSKKIEDLRSEIKALGCEYSDLMPETEYQVRAILNRCGSEQEF